MKNFMTRTDSYCCFWGKASFFSKCIILLFGFALMSGCGQNHPIKAYGTLERDRVSLLATSTEIITTLPIKEGSKVAKGDVLVEFDKYAQNAKLKQAIAERAQAKAQLDKLLNGERIEDIEAAKADLANAKAMWIDAIKQYDRIAQMVAQKLSPPSDKDNALAQRDSSKGVYDAAMQTWKKLVAGARIEDINAAKANLDAAKANVRLQQHNLDNLTVRATVNGRLDSLPYHQGERVATNSIVAILQTDTRPYARIYIPEPYKVKYPPKTLVHLHIDGIERKIKGQIRWVAIDPSFTPYNTMSMQDRSRLSYLAKIDLEDIPENHNLPVGIPVALDLH